MTIGEILTAQARTRPDAVALIDCRGARGAAGMMRDGRRYTFAELEREVARAAAWWHARGLRRGHAVLVFVPMSAELYIALLAMFRLGVVALFLDPSAGREHLERCCARWAPDALLAIPKAHALRLTSAALRRIPLKIVVGGWAPLAERWSECGRGDESVALLPRADLAETDPALVTFTSGSTGVPKAAVRTHGFLVAQHRVLAPAIALEPGEVDLATLPIFTLANLASGATTVIAALDLTRPGAIDGARVAEAVTTLGVTRITASPAFFERMIAHGRATATTLPGLRKLYTGGAPVFPRVLDALRQLAPNAHVVAVYGSTEAEPIAHLPADEISAEDRAAMQRGRGLLAGEAVPEIALRIIRDRWGTSRGQLTREEFESETCAANEAGEIVVTGGHVLRGYLGGVGDEETKFSVAGEVWHRTGDAGLLDDRCRLWLLGRCAAKIQDGGGVLHPFTVECVAMTFSEVRRAAALAHAGGRWLIVEADAADANLEERLRAATAWAEIDAVRFVPRMPLDRRHNAKIDYPALRKLLGA